MLVVKRSKQVIKCTQRIEPITLIYQYFVHSNPERRKEISKCLEMSVKNSYISKIILLNEKIYTDVELGIVSNKVKQVNIKSRICFADVFDYVAENKIKGYIITCNADIFFDKSLENIYTSGLNSKKMVFAQLRFDYTHTNLSRCKLFGPRCDSQDTWIFHSNYNIPGHYRRPFKIHYGIGGCDNKITYLFNILGYEVKNDPYFIKSFHYHKTQIRDYLNKPKIPRPFMFIIPRLNPRNDSEIWPLNHWTRQTGSDWYTYSNNERIFIEDNDLHTLTENLKECTDKNYIFTISRVTSQYNILAHLFTLIIAEKEGSFKFKELLHKIGQYTKYLEERNIIIKNFHSLRIFIGKYLEVLVNSSFSLHYSPGDSVFHDTNEFNKAHRFALENVKRQSSIPLHINLLNIGEQMIKGCWIEAIVDKHITIISPHHKMIEEQIGKDSKFYNKSLFSGCKFNYLNIPISDGNDFIDTINNYVIENAISLNETDLLLIGDTPFDFFLVDYSKQIGKSAISAGKELDLWFGLYTKDTSRLHKDIISLYMNKNWRLI